MVFVGIAMLNPVTVRATAEAEVLRAELHNGDAGVRLPNFNFTPGGTYTISLYFRNVDTGNIEVQWSHWPDNNDNIITGPSAANQWVFHEESFVVPDAHNEYIQIAPAHGERAPGHVYYISSVRITAPDGAVTTVAPSQMIGHWGADVVSVSVVANPEPAAAPVAAETPIPQTGDFSTNLWLIVSGIGLAISLVAFGGVAVSKKKEEAK
jgi:LPXTG-motif cell wall-anchored protein